MPQPRTLATGLMFGESPCWHEGRLWAVGFGARSRRHRHGLRPSRTSAGFTRRLVVPALGSGRPALDHHWDADPRPNDQPDRRRPE